MRIGKMWHKLAIALSVVGVASMTPLCAQTVDVTSIIEHPALDATAQGVHDALKEAGYTKDSGLKWKFQTAQGNISVAAQIARQYVGDKPDAIVAISTPSAQAIVAATKNIPVVYSAVTDPVLAKLVPAMGKPSHTNVTGVSNFLPLKQQVELIKKVVPDAKNVGFVYNPGEANSISYLHGLEKLLPKYGLNLVTSPAPRTVDVGAATRSLVGKVDVIYTSTDNNVVSAYESLVQVADEAKIPLVAADPSVAKRGAAVTLGVDYHQLGVQTGKILVRILKGEKPGDIPSEGPKGSELILNLKAAKKQGITLSNALISQASKVIK